MEIMGLKALVTGGTGFIGSNLVRELVEKNWEVYVLIRKNSSLGYKRLKNVKYIKYVYAEDLFNHYNKTQVEILTENTAVNNLLPQFDVCFHLASYGVDYSQQDIDKIIDGNIKFTLDVLNFCKENGTKKIINTGSCFEYGINEKERLNEKHNINPQSLYGSAKASTVIMANAYAKKYDIPLITVRPFGIFGENEGIHKLIPQIIKSIILNENMKMTLGEQIRDYIYIKDLTDAYIALALMDVPIYEVYNVCSGKNVEIKEIVQMLSNLTNTNINIFDFGAIPYRKNEVMYFVGDNTKIKTYTGWQPKYTLEDGLKRTHVWYKTNLKELI